MVRRLNQRAADGDALAEAQTAPLGISSEIAFCSAQLRSRVTDAASPCYAAGRQLEATSELLSGLRPLAWIYYVYPKRGV